MDQLLKDVGNSVSGLFSSDLVQLGVKAIGVYVVVLWLATAFWAYQDMKSRSSNPLLPYLAAALIIVFTPLLFLFAALLYRIVRPHERAGEAHERMLAEEAMLAEVEQIDHCLGCGRRTEDGWLVCPTCRTRLRRVCPNCSKLVGTDWLLCAWCGTDFEIPQARGASAGAGPYAAPSAARRATGRPAARQATPVATGAPSVAASERPASDRYPMASPAPASRPDPLPAPDDVPPLPDAPRSAAAPTTTWGAVDDVTAPSFVGPGPVEPSVEPAYDPAAGSTGTAPAAPISGRRAAER